MHLLRFMLLVFVLLDVIAQTPKDTGRACRKLRKRVHKLEKRIVKLEETETKLDCPVGYVRYKSSCFWFKMGLRSRSNWENAKDDCLEHGGNLVTISDRRTEKFIRNYLRNNFNNYSGGQSTKLYTGLIYTDHKATHPHDPHDPSGQSSHSADSLRWTATREAVNASNMGFSIIEPVADWSPNIIGRESGPEGKFLSCVVLVWSPGENRKSSLTYRFNSCKEEVLNFICEVRLRRHKTSKRSSRQKRSPPSARMGYNLHKEDEAAAKTMGYSKYTDDLQSRNHVQNSNDGHDEDS